VVALLQFPLQYHSAFVFLCFCIWKIPMVALLLQFPLQYHSVFVVFGHVQHVVDSLESSFRILKLKHKEKNCKKGLKIAENKNEIIFFFF